MAQTFPVAFTEFVAQMTKIEDATVPFLGNALDGISEILRIALVTATVYPDQKHEALGNGKSVTFYRSSLPADVRTYESRRVTQNDSIAIYRVNLLEGAAPWTPEEQKQLDLVLDTLFVFNGRARLLAFADRFTFMDNDGYRNYRYFIKLALEKSRLGLLTGMFASQFNLKHFSLVNRQIGRAMGTFVMRNFIDTLQEMITSTGQVCRIGGDNFIMIAEKQYLDQVVAYLSGTPVLYDVNRGDRIFVTATAGFFVVPEGFVMETESDLMDCVNPAAQAARHNHLTDIVFYNEKMIENKQRISEMQRLFPKALKDREFHVFYQPKIKIAEKELAGAEALCRWFRNGKIVPPNDFIPILESGLEICDLDFYVLDTVCSDIRRWLDEGRNVVRISVNLSRRHMMDVDLFNHIVEIIDRHNVPHKYIEIELTETTTDVEFTDLKRVVNGLQKVGIYTSVDDFGMGYSSLNLIKEIPWNVLKVDKSFLPELGGADAERRTVMFKYVVAMARELGLECITEGVETEEQLQLLVENRCELAQGYLFDRPLPVEEFEKRLDKHHYN